METPPRLPQAVIFDFDGTLIDSYPAITASVNHVRAAHHLSPLSDAEVREHVGRGPAYLLQHTVPGADLAEDLPRYRAHHPSVLRTGTRLLPGVADTLRDLQTAGIKQAVCSNKPRAFTRELVAWLGLEPFISVIVGPEDAPHLKPAPDMLLEALRRLSVAPDNALYVGDMVVDIDTARSAGVPVWVIPTGSDNAASLVRGKPDRVLREFRELAALAHRQKM